MITPATPLPPAPTDAQMNRVASVVAPLERVTQPKLYGVERVPERGVLFVGNHTLFGLIDVPFMGSSCGDGGASASGVSATMATTGSPSGATCSSAPGWFVGPARTCAR
jgi:hypothetical protein